MNKIKGLLAIAAGMLFSSIAHATPCDSPGWLTPLQNNVSVNDSGVAHFSAFQTVIFGNGCATFVSASAEASFDFGDGQQTHLSSPNAFIGWSFDHAYPIGNFVATITESLSINYLASHFETCSSGNQSDCTQYPFGDTFTETRTFAIAHMPEPSTYAMLLAGLGLIGFAARRRVLAKGD
jgi:hypothetical protein